MCCATVAALLGQLGAALAATGSLTLAAGALVLAGAVAAGRARRVREAVILKTLGASRAQIRAAWLVEFGILGPRRRRHRGGGRHRGELGGGAPRDARDWVFLPRTLAMVVLLSLADASGRFAGTEAALRAKAAPLLRNE